MTLFVLGIAIGLLAGGFAGALLQSFALSPLISTIEADRDTARHEARVLRAIIAPGLTRQEAATAPAIASTPKPGADKPTPDPAAYSGRLSFRRPRTLSTRKWFNEVRKSLNTKQRNVDAVAAAFKSQQASQEKSHV